MNKDNITTKMASAVEEQATNGEVQWLLRASQAVMKHHTFLEAAQEIFDIAREATGAPSGYIALMSEDGAENEVLFLESGGLPCNVDEELPMPIRGLRAEAYHKASVVYDNDFENSEWMKFMPPGHVAMWNVLFAPLLIDDHAVGVMGLANKPEDFNRDDARIAQALGDMAAISLRRIRAEEALQEYSDRLENMVEERSQELQEAQEELARQERLAALGQLAGGIAHELRHPLSVISNVAYFLNTTLKDVDKKVVEYLDLLDEEVHSATDIITDLLEFARTGEANPESVSVPTVVKLVLEKHAPPQEVTVETHFPPDLPSAEFDPSHLRQVLTNLVENAYQAMPDGGQLSVSGREYSENGDHGVLIIVQDTGTGIPPENREKIFKPLFTTKPRGIGLGLAIIKNLIEANYGWIELDSVEVEGSTFIVYLPTNNE